MTDNRAPESPALDEESPQTAPSPRLRVLIVDDDDFDASQVARLIRKRADIRTAETAEDALAVLNRWRPHCAFVDQSLPDGDGVDLIAPFRERGCSVALMTGVESPKLWELALERGATDFFLKDDLSSDALESVLTSCSKSSADARARLETTLQSMRTICSKAHKSIAPASPEGRLLGRVCDCIARASTELVEAQDGT